MTHLPKVCGLNLTVRKHQKNPKLGILQNNWYTGREGGMEGRKNVKTLKDELPRDYSRLKRLKRHGIQMLHTIQDQKLFFFFL